MAGGFGAILFYINTALIAAYFLERCVSFAADSRNHKRKSA